MVKETDAIKDKADAPKEGPSEGETKTSVEAQKDAAKLARQQGMAKASAFDGASSMRGLADQVAGAKFEITGLEEPSKKERQQIKDKMDKGTASPDSPGDKASPDAKYKSESKESSETPKQPEAKKAETPEGPAEKKQEAPAEKKQEAPADKAESKDTPETKDVNYPDGSKRTFEYDKTGNVSAVTHPDGSHWDRTGDGQWTNAETGEKWNGNIKVDDKGNFLYYNEKGEGAVVSPQGKEVDVQLSESQMKDYAQEGEQKSEAAHSAGDDGKMGAAGKREPGKLDPESVVTDEKGLKKYDVIRPDGTRVTYERVQDGKRDVWGESIEGVGTKAAPVTSAIQDGDSVVITQKDGSITVLNKDGSTDNRDHDGRLETSVDADGNQSDYRYDKNGKATEVSTTEKGSAVSAIYKARDNGDGFPEATGENPIGYEVHDSQGHVSSIQQKGDSVTVKTGGKTETYADSKVSVAADGGVQVTDKEGQVVYEGKPDGTQIKRNADGKVTDTITPDGSSTHYEYDKKTGELKAAQVKNAEGEVVDEYWKQDGEWNSSRAAEETGVSTLVNAEVGADGTFKVDGMDGKTYERKADGTEEVSDYRGAEVQDKADEIIDKMNPPLTEEQEKQFRRDMAEIAKLPPDQRDAVYAGIDKVMTANTDSTTKLDDQQRRDIVTSMAHSIADPESIQQGGKNSCAAANAEQTVAKERPDVYANTVATLATEGKITVTKPDGTTKTIETQKDEKGKLKGTTDPNGQRSISSEIFQNAAINVAMPDGETYKSYSTADTVPYAEGVDPSTESGERVIDKDGEARNFGGLGAEQQVEILNTFMPEGKYDNKPITSKEELIAAYDENGGPPLNVGIHLDAANFDGMDDGTGRTEGSDQHAVNITYIDKKSGLVYYDNPAGGDDHSYPNGKGVPIKDFVEAMKGTAGDTTGKDAQMEAVVAGAKA